MVESMRERIDRRRIVGIENELGILIYDVSINSIEKTQSDIAGMMGISKNSYPQFFGFFEDEHYHHFLENGSRFYLDTGDHPEISTPECSNIYDLIKYSKANERLLEDKERECNRKIKFRFVKNNYDFLIARGERKDSRMFMPNASYGFHENYQILRSFRERSFELIKLIPFLATRQIINGSGAFFGSKFFISARALTITDFSSSSAHSNFKPVILNRDETFASEVFSRLQIVCGDANMLEWALYLTMGSTRLILEMLENNFLQELILITTRDPILAFPLISKDKDLKNKYNTNFGLLSAIEIQEYYLREAKRWLTYLDKENLITKEDAQIVKMWEITLNALKNDEQELIGKIDWISKKYLLEQYCIKKGLDLSSSKIQMLNIQYHFLNQKESLASFLYKNGIAYKIVSDKEIETAKNNPPQDTRAYLRKQICEMISEIRNKLKMAEIPESNISDIKILGINWNCIKIAVIFGKKYKKEKIIDLSLTDPFDINVEKALSRLRLKGLNIKAS